MQSLSLWECGLKSEGAAYLRMSFKVTLFVRVWIEIIHHWQKWNEWFVTLFVRVWIEIGYVQGETTKPPVTLFVRVWIEINKTVVDYLWRYKSLSLWECGLKSTYENMDSVFICHSLCESVDWNCPLSVICPLPSRHSLCESVDWNHTFPHFYINITPSLSLWECGLKWWLP